MPGVYTLVPKFSTKFRYIRAFVLRFGLFGLGRLGNGSQLKLKLKLRNCLGLGFDRLVVVVSLYIAVIVAT